MDSISYITIYGFVLILLKGFKKLFLTNKLLHHLSVKLKPLLYLLMICSFLLENWFKIKQQQYPLIKIKPLLGKINQN